MKLHFLLGLLITFCFTACTKTGPDVIDNNTNSNNGGNNNNGNNNNNNPPTVTAPNTIFIASQNYTVSNFGAYYYVQFTITKTTTFVFRVTSEYKSQAAILTPDQLNNFTNMYAFTGYALFDNKIGYQTITLNAGDYYVGIRNANSGVNEWSFELDYALSFPSSDKVSYFANIVSRASAMANGGKVWDGFTIEKGYRYFIDGCNVHEQVYIIPPSEIDNFKNGNTFQYYTDYYTEGGGEPGLYEIKLPEGSYYVVGYSNEVSAITYNIEKWKVN